MPILFHFCVAKRVLKGVIWYWVPYFTHEFIYFSSLRNNIFSLFLCSCGNFKDDSFSTHDSFRLWRNPVKFFHVQTAVTAASPNRNSHLLGHYNDSVFFFLRSKYFISGELAVIVIKMAGLMPCWLKYLINECKPYRHFPKPIKRRCIFVSNNKLNIYKVGIREVQDPMCVLTLLHKTSLTCIFLMTILNILLENIVIITLSKRNLSRKESVYRDDSVLGVC